MKEKTIESKAQLYERKVRQHVNSAISASKRCGLGILVLIDTSEPGAAKKDRTGLIMADFSASSAPPIFLKTLKAAGVAEMAKQNAETENEPDEQEP
ncbi:MAG: hypothetical protein BECKG1743D_GA0114223_106532 [Candidatus Kentron sp. G]|nr:MAG: hypothetical protein BECKG1743F_GA0114225_106573 [Candidatus Kentron sp. G]VFN03821.1 MAG: hypothetical protein BECKG1743E_GA0114224_106593 [Candidatus Kentron sp. G]VFN04959.1 MAG: hypothetical protein BECKG1743D_GA0114223_106532 [Candidatus Kentron sp. G]